MAAGAILDLDDPGVGVKSDLARQPLLPLVRRPRRVAGAAGEGAVARRRFAEQRRRSRAEQFGRAAEPIELDEDRPRLLGAAPAYHREGALAVAPAYIGRDPD